MDRLPKLSDLFPDGAASHPPEPDWIPVADEVEAVLGIRFDDPFIMANALLPSQSRAIAPVMTRWLPVAGTGLLEGLLANLRGPQGILAAPAITDLLERAIEDHEELRAEFLCMALDHIARPSLAELVPRLVELRRHLPFEYARLCLGSAIWKVQSDRTIRVVRAPAHSALLHAGEARLELGVAGWDGEPPPSTLEEHAIESWDGERPPSTVEEAVEAWWDEEPRVSRPTEPSNA